MLYLPIFHVISGGGLDPSAKQTSRYSLSTWNIFGGLRILTFFGITKIQGNILNISIKKLKTSRLNIFYNMGRNKYTWCNICSKNVRSDKRHSHGEKSYRQRRCSVCHKSHDLFHQPKRILRQTKLSENTFFLIQNWFFLKQ